MIDWKVAGVIVGLVALVVIVGAVALAVMQDVLNREYPIEWDEIDEYDVDCAADELDKA